MRASLVHQSDLFERDPLESQLPGGRVGSKLEVVRRAVDESRVVVNEVVADFEVKPGSFHPFRE